MAIELIIAGAAGRMGRRLVALAAEQPQALRVVGALEAAGNPTLGQDSGTLAGIGINAVKITSDLPSLPAGDSGSAPVVIDFSAPASTRALLKACVTKKYPLVICTTGLTPDDQKQIDEAAKFIPLLQATNTSLGVNVLLAISAQVARQLGEAYDIEITEAHHNQKKDAPSGTALSLAESICAATGRSLENDLVHGRHGPDALRKKGTVGMHALRMGDVVGEHTIYFATGGERVELRHVATNRDTFARGALRAAAFLRGKKPGRYAMKDVLGL